MRVAVHDGADRKAGERFLEPAAPEERIDLARLAFDRALDRGVVQHRDEVLVAQPRQRRLELQRFVERFVHELLDDLLPPRAERAASEAAAEPLDAGEADAVNLGRLAVEHCHARVLEDGGDLDLLPRLDVMVAEHADHRNAHRTELPGEAPRLFGKPVIGQVARQDEDVGGFRDLRKERLERSGL